MKTSQAEKTEATGLRPVAPDSWCRRCLSIHEGQRCLKDPLASGTERHGRRLVAERANGSRVVHGVLIAPVDGRWRARIVTYPSTLWSYPGRSLTLKFIADQPRIAEGMALEFIRKHCARIEQTLIAEDVPPPQIGTFDREERADANEREFPRKPSVATVAFGIKHPCSLGRLSDLSEKGLFIVTDESHRVGMLLKIHMRVDGCGMPLRGRVIWVRQRAEAGRPRGMGIELIKPPALYRHFVKKLP